MQVGDAPGLYVVSARSGDVEAQAQIRVAARKSDPDSGNEASKPIGARPTVELIRWSGSIPPQKWTTFYMKVVSPFAAAAGLNLRVEVEVPADPQAHLAEAQREKIRNALKELGLDDTVDLG